MNISLDNLYTPNALRCLELIDKKLLDNTEDWLTKSLNSNQLNFLLLPFLDQDALANDNSIDNQSNLRTDLWRMFGLLCQTKSSKESAQLKKELEANFGCGFKIEEIKKDYFPVIITDELRKIYKGKTYSITIEHKHNPNDGMTEYFESPKDIISLSNQFYKIFSQKPTDSGFEKRAFGDIRRDFDTAILVHNRPNVHRYYNELLQTNRLDQSNKIYLRYRTYCGLEEYQKLIEDNDLAKILERSIPKLVLQDIAVAIFEVFLSDSEKTNSLAELTEKNKNTEKDLIGILSPNFTDLFKKSIVGINKPEVIRLFFLHAILTKDKERAKELLNLYPKDHSSYSLVKDWWNETSKEAITKDSNLTELLTSDFLDRNYLKVIRVSMGEKLTPIIAKLLVNSGCSVSEIEEKKKVYEFLSKQSKELKNIILEQLSKLEKQISQIVSKEEDDKTFDEWLEDLKNFDSEKDYYELMNKNITKWNISNLFQSRRDCEKLAEKIYFEGKSIYVFRQCFPKLFSSMFEDTKNFDDANLFPIFERILFILASSDTLNDDDFELIILILKKVIPYVQNDVHLYKDVIDYLSEILENNKTSFNNFKWMVEIGDILLTNNAPDNGSSRISFLSIVLNWFEEIKHRLVSLPDPVLYGLWNIVIKDIFPNDSANEERYKLVEDSDEKEANIDSYSGKICIYTLDENVANRVVQLLSKLIPNGDIRINSDKAETDELRNLAVSSDIFYFHNRKAKHAAFKCIDHNRKKVSKDILWPSGNGTSSITKTILDEIKRNYSA